MIIIRRLVTGRLNATRTFFKAKKARLLGRATRQLNALQLECIYSVNVRLDNKLTHKITLLITLLNGCGYRPKLDYLC